MNDYINYIKSGKKVELIIRNQNGAMRFFSTFKSFRDKCLIVSKPQNKHVSFNYPLNQDLELYAYTDGGIFKLRCKLLSISANECILSLPDDVQRMQRREYIRVNLKVKTILKLFSQGGTKTIQTTSRNISAKGINLLLEEDISKYLKVEIHLLFPEGNVCTLAQIVKSKHIEVEGKIFYDTSLMFITISEKDINFIVKKCFEYEAAQRRRLIDSQNQQEI